MKMIRFNTSNTRHFLKNGDKRILNKKNIYNLLNFVTSKKL